MNRFKLSQRQVKNLCLKPSSKVMVFLVFFFCLMTLANAAITVQLDPSKVTLGETFRLILTSDNQQPGSIPDLTPLQKDFRIIGTERSMNYTLVNGQARSATQWVILLTAKRQGTLTIPSIKFGEQKTQPREIMISAEQEEALTDNDSQSSDTPKKQVFFKIETSLESPYLSQEVIYTIKLFSRGQLLDAEYKAPHVQDALMFPLGGASRYQTTENGEDYLVDEQRYAIFPQKSGSIKISGPAFHALTYDVVPKRINLQPQVTVLNVQPVPASFAKKSWLPAKRVSLTEEYDDIQPPFTQGSTFSRTISLKAAAVPAELLPNIDLGSSKAFSVYPEKPELTNSIQHQELVGNYTVKLTYLLNQSGQITIPAIEIPWFNTVTGQEEIARLPAKTIEVEAKAGVSNTVEADKPSTTPVSKPTEDTMELHDKATSVNGSLYWWLAILFAVAWLVTLFLWWYQSKIPRFASQRSIVKKLESACMKQQAELAKEALIRWANIQWPNASILNLQDIAKRVNHTKLKHQLNHLSQILYSKEQQSSWQGKVFWEAFQNYRRVNTKHKSEKENLPPIHPS